MSADGEHTRIASLAATAAAARWQGHTPKRYSRTRPSTALIPYGVPFRTYMARVTAIRRQDRIARNGPTEKEQVSHAQLAQMKGGFAPGDRCRRGHLLTRTNTYVYVFRGIRTRTCRTCSALRRKGRVMFVEQAGVKVSIATHDRYFNRRRIQLWTAMLAAHPDKGGTSAKFRAARKQYHAFLAAETAWYAQWQLTPPEKRSPTRRPCRGCGVEIVLEGPHHSSRQWCSTCKQTQDTKAAAACYQRRKARRKAAGLCQQCGRTPVGPTRATCSACLTRVKNRQSRAA